MDYNKSIYITVLLIIQFLKIPYSSIYSEFPDIYYYTQINKEGDI